MMPSPDIRPYVISPHNAGLHVRDGLVVYPPGVPRRRKVAIWGFGSTSVRRVPFDSDEFIIYAINNGWNAARDSQDRLRADVWWEMHQITPDDLGPDAGTPIQDTNDMRWINTCPVPLYTTEPWPANPNAVVWDIEFFSYVFRPYFTCTFAMQMAQAIYDRYEEIHLFGVMLLAGTQREATVESSCLNYWLGLAEGRGIKVVVPDEDGLLLAHPYYYGHEYWLERRWVEKYLHRWHERPVAI